MLPEGWRRAARRALLSGTVASIACTLAVSLLGRERTGSLASGTNATSQWVWGEPAKRRHRADLRHTALGYGIHHASSLLWAFVFERWLGASRKPPGPIVAAAAVSTVAYVADYHIVPSRLSPGFDRHLSPRAMFAAYAVFAAGLAVTALYRRRRSAHR